MPKNRQDKTTAADCDRVIIEPRASRADPALHDPAILCPVGPLIMMAARLFKARKQLRPFTPASVYTIKTPGAKVSLVGPAWGAPAAVYVLERMIAHGVRQVALVGLCGSLSPEVKIGDLVVPDGALIEEGTSPHYAPGARLSVPGLSAVQALQKALTAANKSHHLGPVWTTDAVFRETESRVRAYQEEGCLAVEMECSALFTVAAYRGIELGALLVVSDELFDLRWRRGFTRPRFLSASRQAFRIALAAARELAGISGPGPELESETEVFASRPENREDKADDLRADDEEG